MKLSSKGLKILLFISIIVLILFLLNVFSKNVRGVFYLVSSPVQRVVWNVGDSVSDFFNSVFNVSDFKEESEKLKIENQKLIVRLAELDKLKEENEFLKSSLEIEQYKELDLKLVQVTGKDTSKDYIFIDKGERHGVLKDMAVINEAKVIIGRVDEVYLSSSRIMLVSNKDMFFDVDILEKDISGISKGKGNISALLDLIPRDKELDVGDSIITSSLGGIFPEGFLVGRIKNVIRNDIESLQQADIELGFTIGDLNYLYLIYD